MRWLLRLLEGLTGVARRREQSALLAETGLMVCETTDRLREATDAGWEAYGRMRGWTNFQRVPWGYTWDRPGKEEDAEVTQ